MMDNDNVNKRGANTASMASLARRMLYVCMMRRLR